MKYNKPHIALAASAVEAVKGDQTKHSDPLPDNNMFVTSGRIKPMSKVQRERAASQVPT